MAVRGGVRGDAGAVPEKRMDEAGGRFGTVKVEWTVAGCSNGLKADEDC